MTLPVGKLWFNPDFVFEKRWRFIIIQVSMTYEEFGSKNLRQTKVKVISRKQATFFKPQGIGDTTQSAVLHEVRSILIHLRLMRLASCMVLPIAKSGFNPDFVFEKHLLYSRRSTRFFDNLSALAY